MVGVPGSHGNRVSRPSRSVGFALVARSAWLLASRAAISVSRRCLCRGGWKLLALLAVPLLAWRRPAIILPAFLAVLGIVYVPILATGSSAEWEDCTRMAGSFEFTPFGYALLAAMFGSSAARSLWLILFWRCRDDPVRSLGPAKRKSAAGAE